MKVTFDFGDIATKPDTYYECRLVLYREKDGTYRASAGPSVVEITGPIMALQQGEPDQRD